MVQKAIVLRYGHRIVRDERVTSHSCLVARAFGAEKIIVAGTKDQSLKKSVDDIVKRWGGYFKLEFTDSWKKTVKNYKKLGFKAVHATMYGLPVNEAEEKIKKEKKILLIIGSQKVERSVYDEADYNVSVGLQPHSEIAALAVLLDRFFDGNELEKKFEGSKIKIIPKANGKKTAKK